MTWRAGQKERALWNDWWGEDFSEFYLGKTTGQRTKLPPGYPNLSLCPIGFAERMAAEVIVFKMQAWAGRPKCLPGNRLCRMATWQRARCRWAGASLRDHVFLALGAVAFPEIT